MKYSVVPATGRNESVLPVAGTTSPLGEVTGQGKKNPAWPAGSNAGYLRLRYAFVDQYMYVMRRLKARPIGLAALLR